MNSPMIQLLSIIDLDPSLTLFRPIQQKWITSLQFLTESPKEPLSYQKILTITPTLYLLIGFSEKNKPPIYDIDFLPQPSPEWMNVRLPHQYSSIGLFCYKCQETEGPLTDIDILIVEKMKIFGENQQMATVTPGYHMVNTPIGNTYITYRKMKSKLEQTYKAVVVEKYPQNNQRINLTSLPLFCFPEGIRLSRQLKGFVTLNFILTLETAERIYCTCLIFKESIHELYHKKLYIKNNQKIYYQKAMCIASKYSYTQQFFQCLQHLYRLSMSKTQLPFYKIAQNFVDKLQMTPSIGTFGISYSYGGSNIIFKTNKSYPTVSQKAIYCLFKFLTIDIIISVFEAILLERKIIFVSQSKTVLGYASEAFISFIFPFKWQQVLIPILPITLKQYLHAPVPLIAGTSPILIDNTIESESIIVYLDKNQIINEETLPPLPEKLHKQLYKRLTPFDIYLDQEVKEYLDNPENTYIFKMQAIQNPHFQSHLIRDIFYDFILTLMKNYKKYWIPKKQEKDQSTLQGLTTEPQLINDMFKTQEFLSDLNMYKVGSFGYKFTQSSIFTAFMERRYLNPEDPEIVFFDQCLTIKKNKKQTILISEIQNDKYIVCEHPTLEKQNKLYLYDKFPSILPPAIQQQHIQLTILENSQQQQTLIEFIENQYSSHLHFYEPAIQKLDNQLYQHMMSILLKKHKNQFPFHQTNKLNILKWFMAVYQQQLTQIEKFFQNWCDFQSNINFLPISKQQYIQQLHSLEITNSTIIGIHSNNDYQILLHQNKKIFITSTRSSYLTKSNTYYIEVPSFKIKSHLNHIIPKQSLWLCLFVQSNPNYAQWNIQKIIDFHQWILSHHKD